MQGTTPFGGATTGLAGATPAPPAPVEAPPGVVPPASTDTELPVWIIGRPDRAIRAVNIVVASFGILISLPLMLLSAVLVKLSSPGPIIFAQRRVGHCRRSDRERRGERPSDPVEEARERSDRRERNPGGRIFTIYKFRTMTVAEQPKEEWATPEDPRITPLGRFMRKTRLDELPQLFNVLMGDMNIVGPRPEQPGIFGELREQVNGYAFRQKVKPGITGLAQVSLGYDQDIEDVRKKVEKDLEYIGRRGLLTDIWIMVKTVPVMLFRRGSM